MSRERYSKQFAWYRSLAETERSRLDYICNEILYRAGQALMDLNGETLQRKALTTEENSTKFYHEEQKKALEQALAKPLQNQSELYTLLESVLYEIRAGEICNADLYYLKVDNPESSRSKVDPWSFKWFEPAVEVASYLIYVAQIEHIVRSGILESNRRPENGSVYSINEILQLIARQVIISVGGMDEILGQNQPGESKGSTAAALKSNYSAPQLGQIFDNCYNRGLTKKRDKGKFISMFTTGPTGLVFWGGTKEHGAKTALFDIMYRITDKPFLPSELHEYFDPDEQLEPHDRVITKSGIPHSRVGNKIFAGISKE